MMRVLILTAAAALAFASAADAGPHCHGGQRSCGNGCIEAGRVCNVYTPQKPPGPVAYTNTPTHIIPPGPYSLDAKGFCHAHNGASVPAKYCKH
jgi:hypothetical protein